MVRSWWVVHVHEGNLAMMLVYFKISVRSYQELERLNIAARSFQSWQGVVNLGKMKKVKLRSHWDLRNPQRLWQDLCTLIKISVILVRCRKLCRLWLNTNLSWTIYHQVKIVEQQELKSYKLLSSNSPVEFKANDIRFEEMWYIVSAFK